MLSLLTLLVSLLTLNLWGCGPEEPSDAGPRLAAEPIEQPLTETSPATHVQPTGWRGSTGRLGNCPVLWLTQHYAVTVGHCADSNGGVTAGDFDASNVATVPNSMVGRVQNSYGTYTSTMTAKVMLHPGFVLGADCYNNPNGGACSDAEYAADLAVYYVTSGAWANWALHGKNRARTYESMTAVLSCVYPQTTYGSIGVSGTLPGEQTERCDDWDRRYCAEIGKLDQAQQAIATTGGGAGSNTDTAPGAGRCTIDNGDSGFTTYMTTNDYDRPVYLGLVGAGGPSATITNNLRPQRDVIKSADTAMGGPAISSYLYTEDLGGGVAVTYRLYTDAAE